MIAPLSVPHLFWWASASAPDSLPLTFDCLLDLGCHLVIIRENLVNELHLQHQKLELPISTELAIDNKNKNLDRLSMNM